MGTFQAEIQAVRDKLSVLDQLPELVQRVVAVEDRVTAFVGRLEAMEVEQGNIGK